MIRVLSKAKRRTDVEQAADHSSGIFHSAQQIIIAAMSRTRQNRVAAVAVLAVNLAIGALLVLWVGGASAAAGTCGAGDPAVVAGSCTVTIDARDFASGDALTNFTYIINVDNTKLPNDPKSLSTESNSAIVRTGDQSRTSFALPNGRYLITVRSLNHKMWGKHITLPDQAANDGTLTARIELTEQSETHPLPLGKIRVFVFQDNTWVNGAPDTEENGLNGFQVGLEEQTHSAVTVDYNNNPLCGGVCLTGGAGEDAGFAEISNLGPATYFIDVHAPDTPCNSDPNSRWTQTTTIDGGLQLLAATEEGADGTGAPGEQLWEPPNNRTAYWFGFVCSPQEFTNPGTGEIVGTARNWVEWAPYTVGTYNEPVENPFVALSDSNTQQTVYVGRGDAAGNFDIQNVPAGSYNLSVWDEQLTYIMRFKPVTVGIDETVSVNDTGNDGVEGLGVSRWFGWLDGTVYKDLNGNGLKDPGEPGLINTDVDQRWRDGSIKESTFTDATGHYEYPTAEGGALGRWVINEQGFARFSSYPGPSPHDERTGTVTPSCAVDPPAVPANPCIPTDQGGGLLTNQLLTEGHRATVDWGKRDYALGEPGQIVGVTYWATTRNEFEASLQAHEDYEPGIPDVTVLLESLGPDGLPNTDDDTVVSKYVTDHWQQPNASQDPQADGNTFTQNCDPIKDFTGAPIIGVFNPNIGPNCLEVPLDGEQTKDGAFDGGYAFADYCPDGYDMAADNGSCLGASPDPVPLVAGQYIVHVIMPTDPTDTTRNCNPAGESQQISEPHGSIPGGGTGCLYRVVREEDVNVDLGNNFAPAIPPPPCSGDVHVIDQASVVQRSPYFGAAGAQAPLCDKHLVTLQVGQNFNADFNLMTNFRTDPNGSDANDVRTGDIHEPGRLVGQVFNDIYFERNQKSVWYGEPRPIGGIPVGIYARVDTVRDGCPSGPTCITGKEIGRDGPLAPTITYDGNIWRLFTTLTTTPDGAYEALLPSTETFNCPIPQGPCPGMYLVTVDDPGSKAHPNANYNPNLLVATTPAEVWPGLTTQLDTPVDPISGTACEDPAVPARPELLQVSTPIATRSSGRITILADFIGTQGPANATGGRITLTSIAGGSVTTLTRANGGVVSWTQQSGSTPDTIVIDVPRNLAGGQYQLHIITADANGGVSTANGITIHFLRGAYNPPVVNVPPPAFTGPNAHAIQNAINAAAPGSLLVLSPGVYNENVLLWKPLKLQGLGPGGIIGGHELQARDPEDPRFHVVGSVIDGRFFQENATAYDATITNIGSIAGVDSTHPVLRGADITVLAKTTTAYNITGNNDDNVLGDDDDDDTPPVLRAARIDGLGLMTGHGDGAGGIQLQAYANNLRISNNVLENNAGVIAGGIGLGVPYNHTQHNRRVRIKFNRLIGNGGLTTAGGLGIFYDSNGYVVAHNIVCSNFSVNYGAGIAHIGLSPRGSIHDNQIYYNDSVDAGAGLAIESELPVPNNPATLAGSLGDGTGSVKIDRNLIQSNLSGDDGGGIYLLNAFKEPISVRNNMIVNNGAAHLGGAMTMLNSSNVRIINNTIADNFSTASSEESAIGVPHSAGLAAEGNDPLFQATLPAGAPDFSNPVAFFNNIFWNNNAFTLDQFGPGATLVDQGFIDLEIFGSADSAATFTPRFSDLTNGQILVNGVLNAVPADQGNTSGDPNFVLPFVHELTVTGSRLDPQQAAVTITGADPPVGLTGDYHLTAPGTPAANAASPVVDRGAGFSDLPFPVLAVTQTPGASSILAPCSGRLGQSYPADFDLQFRPQLRTTRSWTPWDLGADELPGTPLRIPLFGFFNWNNAGHPLCSSSTEIRR